MSDKPSGTFRAEPGRDEQLAALMEHGKQDLARLVLRVEQERDELREEADKAIVRLTEVAQQRDELAAALRETRAVLGLLRAHRTGPDWDEPIRADLLDREDAALKHVEEGT